MEEGKEEGDTTSFIPNGEWDLLGKSERRKQYLMGRNGTENTLSRLANLQGKGKLYIGTKRGTAMSSKYNIPMPWKRDKSDGKMLACSTHLYTNTVSCGYI